MSELAPSEECRDAVIRSLVCSHCQGLPFLKPCNPLCLDIVKLCLDDHLVIDHAWNKYIGKEMGERRGITITRIIGRLRTVNFIFKVLNL